MTWPPATPWIDRSCSVALAYPLTTGMGHPAPSPPYSQPWSAPATQSYSQSPSAERLSSRRKARCHHRPELRTRRLDHGTYSYCPPVSARPRASPSPAQKRVIFTRVAVGRAVARGVGRRATQGW